MAIKKAKKKVAVAPKKKSKKTAAAPAVEFSAKPAKKKAAVKKATSTGPAKKKAAKKVAVVPKKKAAPKTGATGRSLPRDLNEHGFVKGSNSEKIVEEMLAGGESRQDVADRLRKSIKSANGKTVNAPALMSGLLHRLEGRGYTIESTWKLVPPTPASKAAATRRAKKTAKPPKK